MLKPLRRAAVRVVKPRVSDETWARLRAVDPWHRQSRRGLIAFNKWDKHQYARHHGRHFMDLRRTSFTLLQIGIDGHRREGSGGESLRMWKRLFPKAQIVGLEQDDRPFLNEKRILVYQGSQTDAYLLRSIARKHRNLKIIVDAGSHRPEHIRATFAILFPLLSDGGFYAIEETQTSYWPRFGGSANLKDPATTMSMIKDLLDGLSPRFVAQHQALVDDVANFQEIVCGALNAVGRQIEGGTVAFNSLSDVSKLVDDLDEVSRDLAWRLSQTFGVDDAHRIHANSLAFNLDSTTLGRWRYWRPIERYDWARGKEFEPSDLVDKAIRLLSPAGIGRPQPPPPASDDAPAAEPVEAAAEK